ncbi:MAG TPA: phosphoglycerate kinase, partial [Thermodesulfobacteriota bacterium]|nr:phosphoglycerate kinase [Thermodesulfobacteriota bacterium]
MGRVKYIDELDLKDKKVFVRVDYNCPMDSADNITNDFRIQESLPTLNYILEKGGALILASHLGKPKGKPDNKYSLLPEAKRLSELLRREVLFAPDCIGQESQEKAKALKPGQVLMLENLRFYPEEEKNDDAFALKLASLADCYINDAFGVSHRAHASVDAITRHARVCAAGFLMKKEITYFEKAMKAPARPLVAIVGGAKVSGKLQVLENLMKRVDSLLIGGGMAFTFLKAQGVEIGKSMVEDDLIPTAKRTLDYARERGINILLPVDCVVADKMDASAQARTVDINNIPKEYLGLDIGEKTVALFGETIKDAKTIIWNGPMGVF